MNLQGILSIGRSGLIANQGAIANASQNTANAGTVGYTKRDIDFQSLGAQAGVGIAAIRRRADTWLQANVLRGQGDVGAQQAKSSGMSAVESLFSDPSQGIGGALDAFFTSLRTLSATPTDAQARTNTVAQAQALTQSIGQASRTIQQQQDQADEQLGAVANQVSDLASQIAQLNATIAAHEATGAEASDAKDQRDRLLSQLGQKVSITTVQGDDGSTTVLLAGGRPLVQGKEAASLEAVADPALGGRSRIDLVSAGGTRTDMTDSLGGGTLGGLVDLRDGFLARAATRLDQFAYDLGNAFNTVHEAGYGLDGGTGRPLFDVPTTADGAARSLQVSSAVVADPSLLAAASTSADAVGGNDNLLAMVDLADDATVAGGGTRTMSDEVAGMVASVGREVAGNASALDDSQIQLTQSQSLLESKTGVSLDEEMVDITRFQRSYQASSKIIQTATAMFDALLQI